LLVGFGVSSTRDSGVIDLFAIHEEAVRAHSQSPAPPPPSSAPPPAVSRDVGAAADELDALAFAKPKLSARWVIAGAGALALFGLVIAIATSGGDDEVTVESASAAAPPPVAEIASPPPLAEIASPPPLAEIASPPPLADTVLAPSAPSARSQEMPKAAPEGKKGKAKWKGKGKAGKRGARKGPKLQKVQSTGL
jgi:hypothetical protein